MTEPLWIALAGLSGSLLAFRRGWTDRQLHLALSVSTGTFLAALFLHLLPDVAERSADPTSAWGAGIWWMVLVGIVLVHLVEAIYLRTTERDDAHRHQSVGLVTFVGVSAHALSAGLGVAALSTGAEISPAFWAAFLLHKTFESLAVANVLLLAGNSRVRVGLLLGAFATITPLALLLGGELISGSSAAVLDGLTALATGSFLYVCVAELLPEVYHRRDDNGLKAVGLALGIGVSALLETLVG